MRLIDADALIDDAFDKYCKDCEKRKGIKDGKWRIIYEVGEAPCRACDVDDMIDELENAPTVDAVPVVRCKDCKHRRVHKSWFECELDSADPYDQGRTSWDDDWFCADGERRDDGQTDQS